MFALPKVKTKILFLTVVGFCSAMSLLLKHSLWIRAYYGFSRPRINNVLIPGLVISFTKQNCLKLWGKSGIQEEFWRIGIKRVENRF